MILMCCPFKSKLMLTETCRGFRETTQESEWQKSTCITYPARSLTDLVSDISGIQEVYHEAKARVRRQEAKEYREFRLMVLKMIGFFLLSMASLHTSHTILANFTLSIGCTSWGGHLLCVRRNIPCRCTVR